MQVDFIKTHAVQVIHRWNHFFFSFWHWEGTPTPFHPNCKALIGSHAFVSLGNSHQWANHHMYSKKKNKNVGDASNRAHFIYHGKSIFQMKTAHPSLVGVSANRAEDDRKDMKCRWSNRRGGQARQQLGGKTQTEPRRQSQEQGRKETRRCRGSARGDVPGEGEQGRAS